MTKEDIDRIASEYFDDKESEHEMDEVFDLAKKALEERKEGMWERHYIRPGVYADLWFHATCCGGISSFVTDYCPNCGARMVKPQESEEL